MTTLFDSTFEDGVLYQKPITNGFYAIYVDGGTIEVSAASKNAGNYGVAISPLISRKACGIQYTEPLSKFRQRFYFHPNGLTMTTTRSIYIARNYHSDASKIVYGIALRYEDPNYQIWVGMSNNTETIQVISANHTITNAWHYIETYWQSGSPGSFQLWIDGTNKETISATNDTCRVIYPALGAVHWSSYALSGTFYIDNWQGNDNGDAIGA